MSTGTPDLFTLARASLSAATTVDDLELCAFYLASARIQLVKAREEIVQIEAVLVAREREVMARARPKHHIETTKEKRS